MALKPTIYKFSIDLADLERDNYQALELTVALHPSETLERMAARVLAFCYNADERLQFGRGLSTADEPDVWQHNLDGSIKLWLEVGEPIAERIKKACHRADQVRVYSFNSKSGTWWQISIVCLAIGTQAVVADSVTAQSVVRPISLANDLICAGSNTHTATGSEAYSSPTFCHQVPDLLLKLYTRT